MLKAYFNEKAFHQKQTDHNYSLRGDIEESIGRIPTTSLQTHNSHYAINKKEKDRRYLDRVLHLLQEARRAILADIAQMQIELEQLIKDRDEIIDKRNAISKVLDDLREDGRIEVGKDGYPINEKARAAIKEWEQKTGKKFDAGSLEASEMLHYIILDLSEQESKLDRDIENKNKEIQKANEILEDLDAGIEARNDGSKIPQKTINSAREYIAEKEKVSGLEKTNMSDKLNNIDLENDSVDVTTSLKF
ncbi:hypothetical protein Q4Q35_10795 [Flavivirga aquimarina]|uniref:Uncharacterized protein n=1 Tax=Flavivirga aquimarina TaxID=2027862 RepID=A0ABT8WAY8_9FLAO|nr:hypothetical protein [Flavivirga aquimarina]MDO5970293.1 hypothetical protein [Flavivirga aquimarina]